MTRRDFLKSIGITFAIVVFSGKASRSFAQETVYVASYPRSGSHRLLYDIYSMTNNKPIDLEDLHRNYANPVGPYPLGDKIYEHIHLQGDKVSGRAVYIVRDVRDVIVSLYEWMTYCKGDINKAMAYALDGDHAITTKNRNIGSWQENVSSWMDRPDTLVIKYEDYGKKQVQDVATFLGLQYREGQEGWNSLDHVKAEEDRTKWKKYSGSGEIGKYKTVLTKAQLDEIDLKAGTVMARFGYK